MDGVIQETVPVEVCTSYVYDVRCRKPIRALSQRDLLWLSELSNGRLLKMLTGTRLSGTCQESSAKQRMHLIREFLGASTNAQAVAIAIRKGFIR